jgi:hypothetical protein
MYRLTERGEALENHVRETNSVRHLQTLYNARQDFESDREELVNIVVDEFGNVE